MKQVVSAITALSFASLLAQAPSEQLPNLGTESLKTATLPRRPTYTKIQAKPDSSKEGIGLSEDLLYEAVSAFRSSVAQIYSDNDKEGNYLQNSVNKLSSALETLCLKLDSNLDKEAFNKKEIIARCELANSLLQKYDFIVVDLNFISYGKDFNKSNISFNLERIFRKEEIDCSKMDFSSIGAEKNPLSAKIKFLETRTIIPGSKGETPALPITALMIDAASNDFAILFGHDHMHSYLPNFSPDESQTVAPDLKQFLTNWSLGRLAYHLSIQDGSNKLPEAITIAGNKVGLRASMGLHYALQQQEKFSPEMASITMTFLDLNKNNPDYIHAAIMSQILIDKLAINYPEIKDTRTFGNLVEFFSKHKEASQEYMKSFKEMLKAAVKAIKEQEDNKSKRNSGKFQI